MAKKKEFPVTKEQLVAAAEDMNELMGLDPAIDPEGDEEEMIGEIKENQQYIEDQDLDNPEDPEEILQPETIKTLRKLGIKLPGDEEEEEPEPQRDTSYHPRAKAGIIVFILDIIKQKGPVSKKRILKELVRRFPERDEKGMKNTVNIQVPGRLTKKHGNILKKTVTETGIVRWSIKKKKAKE